MNTEAILAALNNAITVLMEHKCRNAAASLEEVVAEIKRRDNQEKGFQTRMEKYR